jgi:predicted porin
VWYAFYGDASNGKGSAADGTRVGGLTHGSDTGSKQWELSYSYPLSKRTTVYAGYVKLDNDRNAAYSFNINGYTINTPARVVAMRPTSLAAATASRMASCSA